MTADRLETTASGTLLHLEELTLDTLHGAFRAHVFHDIASRQPVVVLLRGDVRGPAPLLTRVHSSCVTSETFGGCDCDCVGQLDEALRAIASEGRGAAFYLMQEGRGAGFVAKARDRMIVQASENRVTTFEAYEQMGLGGEHRRYDQVASALRILGIRAPLRLLTNNPDKVAALETEKLTVESTLPLHEVASPFNLHYLASKSRSGHAFDDPSGASLAAELPETVRYFDPYPLAGASRFLHAASYLLPIQLDDSPRNAPSLRSTEPECVPVWFWLHLYFDRETGVERVVFTHSNGSGALPQTHVLRETLFGRFPLAEPLQSGSDWRAVATEIAAHGVGCAAFLPTEIGAPTPSSATDPVRADAAAAFLLAHHASRLAMANAGTS